MKKYTLSVLVAISILACSKSSKEANAIDPDSLHNRTVGASANELLSSGKYRSLKIEVQYMTGFAPDAAALTHLQDYLTSHLNKPSGISVITKEIAATGNGTLTANEVHALEQANRTATSSATEIAVYILYTNGNYTDDNVLGIAYRNTSAALFGKKIRDNSGGVGQVSRTKLEATVLEHELGHLLGLVDLGSPMQTAHKANGSHCSNQNCLMHFASETTDALGFLLTGSVPTLDAACTNDLKTNGGK